MRVSLPGPGEYAIPVALLNPWRNEVVAQTEVLISAPSDAAGALRISELAASIESAPEGGAAREVVALCDLADLRSVNVLWNVVEDSARFSLVVRSIAARTIAEIRHLDSVPRLIELLVDDGLRATVGAALTQAYRARIPTAIGSMSKSEVASTIEVWRRWFAEQEAQLREGLHQAKPPAHAER